MTTSDLALLLFIVLYCFCTEVLCERPSKPYRQKKWADSALTLQPSDQHK